jgi:hypothetical protein
MLHSARQPNTDVHLALFRQRDLLVICDYYGTTRGLNLGFFGHERAAGFLRDVAAHEPLTFAEGNARYAPPETEPTLWLSEVADGLATVCGFKDSSYAEVRKRNDEVISVTAPQTLWAELATQVEEELALD